MTKIYDKYEIIFSEQAKKAWDVQYNNFLKHLPRLFPDVKPEQLPAPMFEAREDGSGKLFMKVKNSVVAQEVKKGDWKLMWPAEDDKDTELLNKVSRLLQNSLHVNAFTKAENQEKFVNLYFLPSFTNFQLEELITICKANQLVYALMPDPNRIKIMIWEFKPV